MNTISIRRVGLKLFALLFFSLVSTVPCFAERSSIGPSEPGSTPIMACKPRPSWIDNMGNCEKHCDDALEAAIIAARLSYVGCLFGAVAGVGGCGPTIAAQINSCVLSCSHDGRIDTNCLLSCLSQSGLVSSLIACAPGIGNLIGEAGTPALLAANAAACTVAFTVQLCTAETDYASCIDACFPGEGYCPIERPHCLDSGGIPVPDSDYFGGSSGGGFGSGGDPQY